MTVVILGVAFVVIIGGIGTAILGSDIQHRQANADAVLRSAADEVRSLGYRNCAPIDFYDPMVTARPGYPVEAKVVGYMSGADFVPTCPNPADDQGLQLIRIVASVEARDVEETLVVVKRREP